MSSNSFSFFRDQGGVSKGNHFTGEEPRLRLSKRGTVIRTKAEAIEGFSSDDPARYQALSALLPYFEEGRLLAFWAASGAWSKLKRVGITIGMGIIPVIVVLLLPESWRQTYALLLVLSVMVMVTILGVVLQWKPLRAERRVARLVVEATYGAQVGNLHLESLQASVSRLLDFEATITVMYQQNMACLQDKLRVLHMLTTHGQQERAGLVEQLKLYFEGEEEDILLTRPLDRLNQLIGDMANTTDDLLQGDFSASQLLEVVQVSQSIRKQIEEAVGDLHRTLTGMQEMQEAEKDLQ